MARFALLTLGLVLLGAAPSQAQAPEDLRIRRTVVSLPPSVTEVNQCAWTRTGNALLCLASLTQREGRQVVLVRPDGSGLRCLTCAAGVPGARRPHKLAVFPDRRRFLVGTLPAGEVNADEGASLVSSVGECAPSLLDCDRIAFSPVELPAGTGSLNDREIRLSPDGRKFVYTIVRNDGFLVLMGDLVREADRYVVRDARVLNAAGSTTAADLARRGAFAEAKSFSDARTLIYASTEEAGSNMDVYRLDLATGQRQRVTTNGEWDEDAEDDPRGRYMSVGSTRRNFNVLRGATVIPLPPFLDQVKTVFFARFKLANLEERRRALEAWITDDATERAGGLGKQISDLRGGWDARMPVRWSPDGTRLVFYEVGPGTATRLVVVRVRGLKPVAPHCLDPDSDPACRTPTPTWAPLLSEYPPLPPGVRVVSGPAGGSATISFAGLVIGGEMRVDYRDYRTADGLVINGFEQISGFAYRDMRIELSGEVTVSGREQGAGRARVFGEGRRACGTIESRLGARSERTIYGRTDPACGFGPAPTCANRRDDDGDGLEDLTDRGCSHEEDADEAGPAAAKRCRKRRRAVVRVRLHRGERIRRASVRVGSSKVRRAGVRSGRRSVVIDLRGRRARRVRIVIQVRTTSGRSIQAVRRLSTCRRRR